MGERSRREPTGEPGGDVIAEQQSNQHVAAAMMMAVATTWLSGFDAAGAAAASP
jgi:hypothetical protein